MSSKLQLFFFRCFDFGLPIEARIWHLSTLMEIPRPFSSSPRISRRNLFRLIGAGTLLGFSAEAGRVLFGSNEHAVIPGKVYRTAQLTQQKLESVISEKGIKTVINLRGFGPDQNWYMADSQATHAAGISQEDITLSAKRFPPQSEIARLIEVLDRTEYPVLMHCAQGADRTGLASVIVLLLYTKASLSSARRQMWPCYGHLAVGRLYVLDQFFDYYEAWLAARGEEHSPERFRYWLKNDYCPGPFRAGLESLTPLPLEVPTGRGFTVAIRATNKAIEPWVFKPGATGGIKLRYALLNNDGLVYRDKAGQLSRTVQPGESIDFALGFPPIATPMVGLLWADLIDAQPLDMLETDFVQYGSEPFMQRLVVKAG
ncbi:MAG TPA: tyrosine-protein phosphatase [Gemmata sp.]|nr:tyrosine-protein phosphatase [Gemmata sp.]